MYFIFFVHENDLPKPLFYIQYNSLLNVLYKGYARDWVPTNYPIPTKKIVSYNSLGKMKRVGQAINPLPGLLATEGVLKLIGGFIFIFSPQRVLSLVMPAPIPSSALLLVRMLGTQTATLGVCLLLTSPTTSTAVMSRRIAYWTVFIRDASLIAVLGWRLLLGDVDQPLGLTRRGLQIWISELTPFMFGHLWVLLRRPHWFWIFMYLV